jgi:hypothetical protein
MMSTQQFNEIVERIVKAKEHNEEKESQYLLTGQEVMEVKSMGEKWAEVTKRIEEGQKRQHPYPDPFVPVKEDVVNRPTHYCSHPSGIECIQITEHMGFNTGNALKYVWRADLKGNAVQDLEKAKWYIERELALRSKSV